MESKPVLKTHSMQVMEARLGESLTVVMTRLYHEQGLTLAQVGERLGVTIGTVSRWMDALGIEARFPGQRGKPSGPPNVTDTEQLQSSPAADVDAWEQMATAGSKA